MPINRFLTTGSGASVEVLATSLNQIVYSIWYDSDAARWGICGSGGYIATSDDDGETWTTRTSGVTTSLRTIKKWGANWYCVGYGNSSPATALVSTDGAVTWSAMTITTDETSAATSNLVDITFSGSKMLFLGWRPSNAGGILDEIDAVGSVIALRNDISNPNYLYGGHYDAIAGRFYICGAHWATGVPTPYVAYSSTGADGSYTNTTDTGIMTDEIWSIWGEGNRVIAAQANDPYKNFISDNGAGAGTWYETSVPSDRSDFDSWRLDDDGAGTILHCGGNWTTEGAIIKSGDTGGTWQTIYVDTTGPVNHKMIHKAHYGNGIWLAVGPTPNNVYRIYL